MNYLINIIRNRNTILVLAVILGLSIGQYSHYIKQYTIIILAIVMAFSTTGISMKAIFPLKESARIMAMAASLNYLVASTIIIILSYIFVKDDYLFYGLIVIASSPPGVAVIPFTFMLNGDLKYSIIGMFGAYLSAIFIAPFIISFFTGGTISSIDIFYVMLQIILIPIVASRILLIKPLKPIVEKVRGRIIDWGFALIIFTAVGLNRQVFFSNFNVLFLISFILLFAVFGVGLIYDYIFTKKSVNNKIHISKNLFLTVKSSGFTAATSLALFGEKAAIPSAILSVVVLSYLLFLSFRKQIKEARH